jgi:uncharacterized membrane protein
MKWHHFGVAVAVTGAIMHVVFAYLESIGWGPDFVSTAAPSWMDRLSKEDPVTWARKLAYNVAAYNLMLAVGLAWTCWAIHKRQAIAGPLGIFFAIWLLVAAAAALCTKVFLALPCKAPRVRCC